MSSWLTEQDIRDSQHDVATWPRLTLNVAFLNDIKRDAEKPEEIIEDLNKLLSVRKLVDPFRLVFLLGRFRDELQSYFTLEEFYGYFHDAKTSHPQVSVRAEGLRSQHEQIFLEVCELLELAEAVLYRESPIENSMPAIIAGFHSLVQSFRHHEQEEFELMMRLCNDDLGGSG